MDLWPTLSIGIAAVLAVLGWIRGIRGFEAVAVAVGVVGGMTWWPVSLYWAWAHHGFAVLVWIVMAVREYRSWTRRGGGLRGLLEQCREERAAQDELLAWVLVLLSMTLIARGDPISAAVVFAVAVVLIRRGRVDAAAPLRGQEFDWRAFGRSLSLILLALALLVLIVVLATLWVAWIDGQSIRLAP